MINISKSEKFLLPELSPYKTVIETKTLGVLSYTSQKNDNFELILSSYSQKHRGLILNSNSLRAKYWHCQFMFSHKLFSFGSSYYS